MISYKSQQFINHKNEFKKIMNKSKVSRCLFSSFGECSNKIINAHSIQNNRILNKISKKGMVMVIGNDLEEGELSIKGRKIASIFSGFCSKHDAEIFFPIENKDYNSKDQEQEFLFAYRAICKEIISKEQQKNIYEYINNHIKKDMINSKLIEGVKLGLLDLSLVKNKMDQSLLKKDFSIIESVSIKINNEAKFSVSSIFFLERDFEGNVVNDLKITDERAKPLFLTIFPQNGKTYVLFSYLREDKEKYILFNKQLLSLSEIAQTEKISLLVTLYCENFVYSPDKWDAADKVARAEFIDLFKKTMYPDKINFMNIRPPLNFFS